jgi:hypothetical protein
VTSPSRPQRPAARPKPGAGRTLRPALLALAVLGAGLVPASAPGQGGAALPASPALLVDLKKAGVGSWAEYRVKVGTEGDVTMTARWAFLGRDEKGNTLELTVDGPAAATGKVGGKVVTRMLLAPDPIGMSKPFRQLVMQVGEREPLDIPVDMTGLPQQKFQNPDAKKMVGKETITVAAGTLATSHYRDVLPDSTVDSWLSDEVHPLGVVKIVSTPRPDAAGPGGRPLPLVTMELLGRGRDARPTITRAPRPFTSSAPAKE